MHIVSKFIFLSLLTLSTLPLIAFQIPGSDNADLQGTYSNKIVRDNFNRLHLAYVTTQGELRYQRGDIAGTTWTNLGSPPSLQVEYLNAVSPALDVDHWGNIGIAVIDQIGTSGQGVLHYYYKGTSTANTWWFIEVSPNSSQPSVAIRGGITHLTWIQDNQVKYTSFPATAPPYIGPSMVETVATSFCNIEAFAQPSIGLIKDHCVSGVPVIGYMVYSKIANPNGLQCPALGTNIGPVVKFKDSATQVWTQIYSDIRSVPINNPFAPQTVTALSLSTFHHTASIYLAYSDVLNGSGRTKIAVGNGLNWQNAQISPTIAMPIDILANTRYNGAQFRISYQDAAFTFYRTGKWKSNMTAPNWIETPQVRGQSSMFPSPHSIFAKNCYANSPNTHIFSELQTSTQHLGIISDTSPDNCANEPPIHVGPCIEHRIHVRRGNANTTISLEEAGVLTREIGPNSIEFLHGDNRYLLFWEGGDLEELWPNGFVVAGTAEIQVQPPPGLEAPEIVYLFEEE